jgi:rhodanese-related sulfurtransferase
VLLQQGGKFMLTTELPNPAQCKEFFEDKLSFTTGPVEVSHMLDEKEDVNIIDVRYPDDFAKGHIPGAFNCPPEKWSTCEGLDKDKRNVLYCYTQQCHLAAKAAVEFASRGYPVMEMEGGFEAWQENELPIEK